MSSMAPFSSNFFFSSSLLLLLVFSFSSLQTHARESQFFNKAVRHASVKEANYPPEAKAPAAAIEDKDPMMYVPESQNGYGLYGHGQGQLPPSSTTTTTDKYDSRFGTENFESKQFNTEYNNNNNNMEKKKSSNYDYYSNGIGSRQYGMSDTRFLENGKYYYDVNSEKERISGYGGNYPQVYGSFGGYNNKNNQRGGENYGYGRGYDQYGKDSKFEYNNYMEGYDQSNQKNAEGHEGYIP